MFHGRLWGRELAVWRADDGHVNIWENRCAHRGVRLTTAINDGAELACQYHGWRYLNRSGTCSYIPAHPAEAPARSICVATYPVAVAHGLVWTGAHDTEPPTMPDLDGATTVLRALPVHAPAEVVLAALADHTFEALDGVRRTRSSDVTPHSVTHTVDGEPPVVHFVQPADGDRAIIRPVLADAPAPGRLIDVLRHHSVQLERLRGSMEAERREGVRVALPTLEARPGEDRADLSHGREAALELMVDRKFATAPDVCALELRPRSGNLISFQPGAHIDVHLPTGLVRQYSLTNGPEDTDCYRIGVKLEPESRGGSRFIHETLSEGDRLGVSAPHNNFTLRRDAHRTILLAGGIGVTPLLAMAQTLARQRLRFELHYFVRDHAHRAFPEILAGLDHSLTEHVGLSPEKTLAEMRGILGDHRPGLHTYICGPGPMLEAARRTAADSGWPDEAVHFEYFENTAVVDASSTFEVDLARTGTQLTVEAGETLLGVLRRAGIPLGSSCEQGACGTCMVSVLEGEPDHQDVYLSGSERARSDRMLSCVSRARGERLVLDL